ncbi:MYG1 protein C27H6.8 [Lepeophtheirus salmonis]|uniref:MYG1 protein C27H6.8 n=1 Tax=Lepeophtheirus salmonis TaxID=72036 RepID=UPI001AE23F51|nr:MYG1 protein C27H6.8-like [Lepeophtheirus salmonis]
MNQSSKLLKMALKIGTHNGVFHADEVTACMMLKLLPKFKDAEIIRTRDQKILDTCDIVVDVGGVYDHSLSRYDHHQKTFNESLSTIIEGMPYVTKLSSAGLIYAHYGKEVIGQRLKEINVEETEEVIKMVFERVYKKFIEEIDAGDNGIPTHDGVARYDVTTNLASRVSQLKPNWNDIVRDFDSKFFDAINLVRPEFLDRIDYYAQVWWPARRIVKEAVQKRLQVHESGKIIAFDRDGCPFSEHIYQIEKEEGIEILYVIFHDASNDTWRVLAVSVEGDHFNQRLKLKKEWRGLRDGELSEVSGIPGCIFVHAGGFIGGNKTRSGALQMAVDTLNS